MKAKAALLLSLAFSLGTSGILLAKGKEKDKWVCMKDEAEVKVKGKTAQDKGKDCEAQGGSWAKADHHAAKQSSGGGGAW
jgi:hypothetical protein